MNVFSLLGTIESIMSSFGVFVDGTDSVSMQEADKMKYSVLGMAAAICSLIFLIWFFVDLFIISKRKRFCYFGLYGHGGVKIVTNKKLREILGVTNEKKSFRPILLAVIMIIAVLFWGDYFVFRDNSMELGILASLGRYLANNFLGFTILTFISSGAAVVMCYQLPQMQDASKMEFSQGLYQKDAEIRNSAEIAEKQIKQIEKATKYSNIASDESEDKVGDEGRQYSENIIKDIKREKELKEYAYHLEYLGYMFQNNNIKFSLLFDTITYPNFLMDEKAHNLILSARHDTPDFWNGSEYLYRSYEIRRKFDRLLRIENNELSVYDGIETLKWLSKDYEQIKWNSYYGKEEKKEIINEVEKYMEDWMTKYLPALVLLSAKRTSKDKAKTFVIDEEEVNRIKKEVKGSLDNNIFFRQKEDDYENMISTLVSYTDNKEIKKDLKKIEKLYKKQREIVKFEIEIAINNWKSHTRYLIQ